jgi:hypothetical protein
MDENLDEVFFNNTKSTTWLKIWLQYKKYDS